MAESLGYATLNVVPSAKGFGKALKGDLDPAMASSGKAGGSKLASSLKAAAGPLFAIAGTVAVGAFIKSAIAKAGDLEQSMGAIDTVFKNNSAQVHEWAKGAAMSVGLARNEYNELATLISTQLKNAGTAMDDLGPKTNNLIGLGADLASMFGGTSREAIEAISSALKGERDPIERYGVSLKQATIDAKAAELGFSKVGGTLSNEANAAATLALIMEQTADAHGNFAKEAGTYQGVLQRLSASWENVSSSIGTFFLPFATAAASVLLGMMPTLQGFAGHLASVGAALSAAFEKGGGGVDGFKAMLDTITSGVATFLQGGGLTRVFESIANARASFFAAMMQALPGLVDGIAQFIPQLAAFFAGTLIPQIAKEATTLATTLANVASSAIPALVGALAVAAPLLLSAAVNAAQTVLTSLSSVLPGIITSLVSMIPSLVSTITGLVPTLIMTITAAVPNLLAAGVQLFNGLVTAAVQAVPPILAAISAALPSILSAIIGLIPVLVEAIMSALPQFVDGAMTLFLGLVSGLTKALPGIVGAIIAAIPQLVTAIIGALPQIITGALSMFLGIVQGLAKAIPQIVTALVAMIPTLVKTIVAQLPAILQGAVTMFLGIVQGIAQTVPKLISALIGMIPTLVTTIIGALPQILSGAIQLFLGLVKAIPVILPQIVTALIGMAPQLVGAIIGMVPQLFDAGVQIIRGLLDGIASLAGTIGSFFLNLLPGWIVGPFKAAMGIHSPSRLFASFGKYIGQGLIKGLTGSKDNVRKATTDLANVVKNAFEKVAAERESAMKKLTSLENGLDSKKNAVASAKERLAKAQKSGKGIAAAKRSLALAEKNLKTQKSQIASTKALIAADSKVLNSKTKSNLLAKISSTDKALEKLAVKRDKVADKLADARDKLADAVKLRDDFAADMSKKISAAFNVADYANVDDIMAGLKATIDKATEFRDVMATLRKRGLNDTSYQQLLDAFTSNGDLTAAKAILAGGGAAIEGLNDLQGQLDKLADGIGSDTSKALYQAGVNAAQGLVKGLEAQQAELDKLMEGMANKLVTTVKKALGIHSPSRVFAGLGVFVGQGLANGIESMSSTVADAALGVANAAADAVSGVDLSMRADVSGAVPPGGIAGAVSGSGGDSTTLNYSQIGGQGLTAEQELVRAARKLKHTP